MNHQLLGFGKVGPGGSRVDSHDYRYQPRKLPWKISPFEAMYRGCGKPPN